MIEFKGKFISPREVITYLKNNLQIKELCNNILYQKIINKAAEERNIQITPEEIQIEAERLRYEKRLVKASDTLAWLADHLISSEDWEAGIRDSLLSKKLAEVLFGQQVEKYFWENKLNYDQVLLYQIVLPYQNFAQEIYYQIEEGELSFYEAAHIYDIDEIRRNRCGYEGKFYRWSFEPDIAAVIFNAQLKELLGPMTIKQTSYIFMVEDFIPAELTPERYQEILNKMFQEWLTAELNYLLYA
ncbi:peptidylprolyl isomerase [Fortiea sp. LEGE XX443]|uniref:peptidylprolyl isomerase n=1 Tax=Fortiea sp. LEGE XX443 TaxID=1828611 RepID=UPI00187F6ED4|nr:peptidylprolyl isomerase [Fortiea sp. LEGE XX443]MBE9005389.1 peptidylprolyl isomerase [Fortiea sp. LEGE XX443]